MLKAVFDFNHVIGILAGLSVVFGAVYMLRFFQKTMYGPSNDITIKITDIGTKEMMVLVPIVIVVLLTGVFPNLILDISASFVNSLGVLNK
jgi:NADH-quinone oxidoreductase subunit M